MTEELNPEFLEFSQMLDEEFEVDADAVEHDDHKVLVELRDALREEQANLELESEFAQKTAHKIEARYQALPYLTRLWSERSHLLFSNALGRDTLKWSGGLLAGGFGLALMDLRLLGLYGLVLTLMGANIVREELFQPVDEVTESVREFTLSRLIFFLLPALAFITSGLAGGSVYAKVAEERFQGPFLTIGLVIGLMSLLPCWLVLERLQNSVKNQKRVNFWVQVVCSGGGLVASYLLLGTLGSSYSLPLGLSHLFAPEQNASEAWLILGAWVLAGGILTWLSVFTPEENLPIIKIRSTSSGRLEWLGSLSFYLLPATACLASGWLTGSALYTLGKVSLAFRDQSGTGGMALVGGLGIAFLLRSALIDLWAAIRKRTRSNPRLMVVTQLLHAIWVVATVTLTAYFLLSDARSSGSALTISMGAALGIIVVLIGACFTTYFCTPEYQELPELRAARRRFRNSLLFSLIPIALALVTFYQMHLTRQIQFQERYRQIQTRVDRWVQSYQEMPPEQNGWYVLSKYFTKKHASQPEVIQFDAAIEGLSKFEVGENDNYAVLDEKGRDEFERGKSDFLELRPLLQKGLGKPYFNHISTEGFGFESEVPNFVRDRAISQAFNLLVEEAKFKNDWDAALEYGIAGLEWGSKGDSGSLIEMMIKVAMLAITHSELEEVVLSGELSEQQLSLLSDEITAATISQKDYLDCMEREFVLTDRFIKMFASSDVDRDDLDFTGLNPLLAYMPRSFWESERKAYWNHQLGRYHVWTEMNLDVEQDEESDLNPLNVTTSTIIPNTKRALAQFAYSNSRLTALKIQCELERYKLAHGGYPENLVNLVPDHLEELPEDMMKPNKLGQKGTFDYQKTEQGYLLISHSSVYKRIAMQPRQVYGHDGNFEERR